MVERNRDTDGWVGDVMGMNGAGRWVIFKATLFGWKDVFNLDVVDGR